MGKLCRIVGMILVFPLLASASAPVSAWLQRDAVAVGGDSRLGSVGLTPDRGQAAAFLPGWHTYGYSGAEPVQGADRDEPAGWIEPELKRAVSEAEPDETVRVIVHLGEQVDVSGIADGASDVVEARSRVVEALRAAAARSQGSLRAYLEGAQAAGLVDSYTSFWIFNGMAVRCRPAFVESLAAHPTVVAVALDHWRQWVPDPTSNLKSQIPDSDAAIRDTQSASSVEWGIARIRADQVWSALHISGTGAVVAGLDTGVDWLHPALAANYRGHNPHGPANHIYNWYDATGGGAVYPVDGHGHGSHTVGTVVGQGGIGVAPGAEWIAVRALNNQGFGLDSWLHKGFQWLLAPEGDPSMAPDVVNNSWGSDIGYLTTFQPDLQALRAAGIFVVFSNGNDGPGAGTVGSPASLPDAFGVGASDPDDEVARFSSRGPSPWGEIRPLVVAPGVHVRSSMPGGAYALKDGTSMAAPHVAGIATLLRSISPTLSITRTGFIITSTARPLTSPVPNNDSGWGRVDAFSAVAALVNSGFISGEVTQAGGSAPIAGAKVVAVAHGVEGGGTDTTDGKGSYFLALAPAAYDLTASAFGHQSAKVWGAQVTTGAETRVDISLTPLPSGIITGRITDALTGLPVTATVDVLGTPLQVEADAYTFTLPSGTYIVRARALAHRVATTTVDVLPDTVTGADLALSPAPSILLVDSGSWYYGSQADYFRQALDDLGYGYDERSVKHLPDDVPTAPFLSEFDIVIWSSPLDSPGYVGANGAIGGYLSNGGNLFLSGQDVGFWDGGGTLTFGPYFRDYLKARFISDDAPTRVLNGMDGDLFAGLVISIAGSGGADNQDSPDEIEVSDPDAAASLLTYEGGLSGGLRAGNCLDYRAVYLAFGFEAINDRDVRREVMGRSLDWLTSPLPTVGLELTPASQMGLGLPGSAVTHTVRIRHTGQGGITDVVSLSLDGASWHAQLSTPSVSLTPCRSANVVITVTVPPTAGWDLQSEVTLVARSTLSPTLVQTAVVRTKAPAPILLVDDDRWYNQEAKYEAALSASGFPYDYWRTGGSDREPPWGSPSLDMLQRYPVLVWYTGYDWFRPVTDDEEQALAAYLDNGGRLFLSSQDYMYYHHDSAFSRDYLGAVNYTEDVTPTMVLGVPGDPIGDRLGPYLLDYPFRNWSDAVDPAPGVAVGFREQARLPVSLARQAAGYRTVFFSFPFEALPEAGRGVVMERVVGWLSWLGGSTFDADREAVSGGDTLVYTAVLRNDGPTTVTASFSNTLPLSLTLIPGGLPGSVVYYTTTRRVSWEEALGPGAEITLAYRAAVTDGLAAGTRIVNTAHLGLEEQDIRFSRAAVVRVGAPDLSSSTLGCEPDPARPGAVVTCTLELGNDGPGEALSASVTNLLPPEIDLVPSSPTWIGGGSLDLPTGMVRWSGPLGVGEQVTLSYQISLSVSPVHHPMVNVAFLEDGVGGAWERMTWLVLEPWCAYLPLVLRDS